MTPKLCLSEEQLSNLELCYEEVIKKKVHLKTYLLLMFAEKYPNLNLSYNILKICGEKKKHHTFIIIIIYLLFIYLLSKIKSTSVTQFKI